MVLQRVEAIDEPPAAVDETLDVGVVQELLQHQVAVGVVLEQSHKRNPFRDDDDDVDVDVVLRPTLAICSAVRATMFAAGRSASLTVATRRRPPVAERKPLITLR